MVFQAGKEPPWILFGLTRFVFQLSIRAQNCCNLFPGLISEPSHAA